MIMYYLDLMEVQSEVKNDYSKLLNLKCELLSDMVLSCHVITTDKTDVAIKANGH